MPHQERVSEGLCKYVAALSQSCKNPINNTRENSKDLVDVVAAGTAGPKGTEQMQTKQDSQPQTEEVGDQDSVRAS